ncbi:aromatic ring-hydroxylating dioxygenase subunit alpha [Dietzia cercidiphylli]|uniref:aromatic ring-hydroxylating dioxygenase subunit alpha n=1 Tax=Dietzia cercidiphylli TaxID=498199 RepID=UPI003F7D3E7D
MTIVTSESEQFTDIAANDWPLNAWYVAAWDHEVGRSLRPCNIAGKPVVLYRTTDGEAIALADACWHRLVPLSVGKLDGNEVQCGYHGIKYDRDGKCTFMPAQETINPSAGVHSYPVVERHRFVWVWPGDASVANPDLIPDLFSNGHPDWVGDGDVIPVSANYQLVLDNLMDLTHEEFIHTSSIGNEHLSVAPFDAVHDGNTVTVTRWMRDIPAPPLWQYMLNLKFPGYSGLVDRWQIINFMAPATISLDVGVAIAGTGAPEGDRSQGVNAHVLHTMTPTSAKSCQYHWAINRNFAVESPRVTKELKRGVANVFAEDEAMLNAQQAAIDANPGYDFYNLNIDAGGMWVRRIIASLIAKERS